MLEDPEIESIREREGKTENYVKMYTVNLDNPCLAGNFFLLVHV